MLTNVFRNSREAQVAGAHGEAIWFAAHTAPAWSALEIKGCETTGGKFKTPDPFIRFNGAEVV
jgi:hypothetical protein